MRKNSQLFLTRSEKSVQKWIKKIKLDQIQRKYYLPIVNVVKVVKVVK
jgi:hypothetical protein